MNDDSTPSPAPRESADGTSRRHFLKVASAVAASAAAAATGACAPSDANNQSGSDAPRGRRTSGFDRATLDAVGEVMLPASLGEAGRTVAVDAFVTWVDGYEPVAEEMHGYGYADVRYLPADPAPGWRAQLDGLDTLARKMRAKSFAQLDEAARRDVLTAALASVQGRRLPSPVDATHVAVALVAHWAASAGAWDLALGAHVGTGTCRQLEGVAARPLPIVGVKA